jgi:RHS repeat-associated protein
VTDARGWSTNYNYDDAGLKTSATDPQGQTAKYAYDGDQRLTSTTDRLGRRTDYAYDDDGRRTQEKWWSAPDPVSGVVTLLDTRTFTYDANGNLTGAANGLGAYSYNYDDAMRLSATTDLWGLTLTLGYDKAGHRTQVQDSLGGTTNSFYDQRGRLSSRQFSDSRGAQLRFDLGWTPRGELAGLARFADVAGQQLVGASSYTYDPVSGLVKTLYHYRGGTPTLPYSGGVLVSYVYDYDPGNRLTSEQENGYSPAAYRYDRADQLTAGPFFSGLSWDAAGNRTDLLFSQGNNKGNQLATDGTWDYSYDAEGNLVQKSIGPNAETWVFTYDNANQLTSAEDRPTPTGLASIHLDYKYDALGRRVERDVTTGGATTKQRYAYDPTGNEWADLDGSGASNVLVARHFFTDRTDELVARLSYPAGSGAPAAAWDLLDRLGSVRVVMAGDPLQYDFRTYDAFGGLRVDTNPALGDRYGYTGRERDDVTGLQYNRARWYDPATQRWTSRDPLEFAAGDGNLYRYVGNNAANRTDPSGQIWGLGATLSGAILGGGIGALLSTAVYVATTSTASDNYWRGLAGAAAQSTVTQLIATGGSVDLDRVQSDANSGALLGAATGVASAALGPVVRALANGLRPPGPPAAVVLAGEREVTKAAAAPLPATLGGPPPWFTAAVVALNTAKDGVPQDEPQPPESPGAQKAEAAAEPAAPSGDKYYRNQKTGQLELWEPPPGPAKIDVPSVADGAFYRWFNKLTPDEIKELWKNPAARDAVESRLRSPGGFHEWLPVSRAPQFREWGITAEQIHELRTPTNRVEWQAGGAHGRLNSTSMHNEILQLGPF